MDDLGLFFLGRIVDPEIKHEPVELGLGQGVGSFLLDGVLGGQDEEGFVEFVGFARGAHLVLLHGLEKGRLGLGGGFD